ncbi:MAG: 30S ribosomal protein S8 [Candidatus Doudnabacteria bacterium]|nr:30S ribosomal protein S8 [Candidatus Doudnabacteria bacterium]
MTDTISDMLTRIRNAQAVKKTEVLLPFSNFKFSLGKVLLEEGWIKSLDTKQEGKFKQLSVGLKYSQSGEPVISGVLRVSKPGQRIYSKNSQIPAVQGGFGTTIISTSRGLMTDKKARTSKVGGEIICQIW